MKAKIVPKKEIVLLYRHEQAKNAQALLPLLCALGVLSGLLIGALAHQVLNRLQRERE